MVTEIGHRVSIRLFLIFLVIFEQSWKTDVKWSFKFWTYDIMKLTMLIIFCHCSYYVDINSAGISNFYKDFTKTRLLDSWFSPYNDTSIFYWNVLPKAGFNAQKSLIRSKELIMSKAFKQTCHFSGIF